MLNLKCRDVKMLLVLLNEWMRRKYWSRFGRKMFSAERTPAAPKICRKTLTRFELITRITFKARGETLNRAFSSSAGTLFVDSYVTLIILRANCSPVSKSDDYSASYDSPQIFPFLNYLTRYEDTKKRSSRISFFFFFFSFRAKRNSWNGRAFFLLVCWRGRKIGRPYLARRATRNNWKKPLVIWFLVPLGNQQRTIVSGLLAK